MIKAVTTVADREFKVQVMKTEAQWKSGLHKRLNLDRDGLSLFLNPVLDSWVGIRNWDLRTGDIVVDECGQTYWTALDADSASAPDRVWHLFRHNPSTNQVEKVLTFPACGRFEPRKLWLTAEYLWIFDETEKRRSNDNLEIRKGRMLGLSRENSQIVNEVAIENLIDVDFDRQGFVCAVINDGGQWQVCRYAVPPHPVGQQECFTLKSSKEQVAIAVGRDGILFLLDTSIGRFVRFDPVTREETLLAAPKEALLKGFKHSAMQIDDRGVIFLAESEPAHLHMFAEDGSYLDEAELPSDVKRIDGIGFDRGAVYLATDRGLAKFTLSKSPVGQDGLFYSKTLDNGQPESFWHRIALEGRFPGKSSVEVFYYTSDNQDLKTAYERAFSSAGSVEERALRIESLLERNWIGPEIFKGAEVQQSGSTNPELSKQQEIASPDLILDPNKGRFLWLKLRLITFDQRSRPSIRSARIYYPRLSYLRYLPPVYREEPLSAAFLERFLSIFETAFEGLDQEIDQLFRYFDPLLAPKEFLPWLGSWINLSLDDELPEARIRRLIRRAPYLYSRKGTPEALIEFLEIYTGRRVSLTEHMRGLKPLILGATDLKLGSGVVLLGSGPKGMWVGDTTIVGEAAIRDRVSDADEPFLPLARRFTIAIDMDREEFQKRAATLQRITTEQTPSHTICKIQIDAEQKGVGNAILGAGASVTETQPYQVGITPLGSGSAMARDPRILRLERGAWIGSSVRV